MTDLLSLMRRQVLEQAARQARPLYVWGAGGAGRTAAAAVRSRGIVLAGFIDRDPAKSGMELDGCRIQTPDALSRITPRPRILIASMYHREIAQQLRRLGFRVRRDFEVFPSDSADLPVTGADPEFYRVWRAQWFEQQRFVPAGHGGAPSIRTVHVGVCAADEILSGSLDEELPVDRDAWVALCPFGLNVVRWHWRGEPTVVSNVVRVELDPLLRMTRGAGRPFLIEHFRRCARVPRPVVGRAGAVRDLLRYCGNRATFHDLSHRMMATGNAGDAIALGEFRLPAEGRRDVPSARSAGVPGVISPVLRDFVLEIARAGLPVFTPDEAQAELPRLADAVDAEWPARHRCRRKRNVVQPKLQVVSHGQGNFFFAEIREFLAESWRRAGATVESGDERTLPRKAPWRRVIIAPHEFFTLDETHPNWRDTSDAILFNTEQPHTRWFAASLERLLTCRLVLDINWQSSMLLRTLGARARFLPLGVNRSGASMQPRKVLPDRRAFEGLDSAERRLPDTGTWAARPIDILFVGTLSARRSRVIAKLAPVLAQYRCFFHLPPANRPLTAGSPDGLDSRDMADLCRRAKIVLNIHRDTLTYCEWHRVVFQAMAQGALVVSEPMMEVPGLRAGEHYAAAPESDLAGVLHRTLTTGDGRRKAAAMVRRATRRLNMHFDARRIASGTLDLIG